MSGWYSMWEQRSKTQNKKKKNNNKQNSLLFIFMNPSLLGHAPIWPWVFSVCFFFVWFIFSPQFPTFFSIFCWCFFFLSFISGRVLISLFTMALFFGKFFSLFYYPGNRKQSFSFSLFFSSSYFLWFLKKLKRSSRARQTKTKTKLFFNRKTTQKWMNLKIQTRKYKKFASQTLRERRKMNTKTQISLSFFVFFPSQDASNK